MTDQPEIAPVYSREVAQRFIEEPNKQLADAVLRVQAGKKPSLFPIRSTVEPNAHLFVRLAPDGDFALQAFVPNLKAVICRWDRAPHRRPPICDETSEEITNGHKHYMEHNVEPPERLVKRGPEHIPTSSLRAAVDAFCRELNILPPQRVVSSLGTALKEVA